MSTKLPARSLARCLWRPSADRLDSAGRRLPALAAAALCVCLAAHPATSQEPTPPDSVEFYGVTDEALFAGGIIIPAGQSLVWTSGTTPPVFNERAEPGTRERYGDTRIQATGALHRVEDQLAALDLSIDDVIYIRAYLVPDPLTGTIDTEGWNAAFAEFFGTDSNPRKPGRATVGVAALTNPDWLVEIEAVAVHP